MAVKPLISSFKQRRKTMYLGEAAKEMAPPLLLGAALLILTLSQKSRFYFAIFQKKNTKKSQRSSNQESHQTSCWFPPILEFFPIWNECRLVAASSQLSWLLPLLQHTTSVTTFSSAHVMQIRVACKTCISSCWYSDCLLRNFTTSRCWARQGSCPMWGAALHSCVWPQVSRDPIANSDWPAGQSRGLDRQLWLAENAPTRSAVRVLRCCSTVQLSLSAAYIYVPLG